MPGISTSPVRASSWTSRSEGVCERLSSTLRETVGNTNPLAPGAESAGELQAYDPVTGKTVWRVPWKVANNAPVTATAGDLLFQGGPNEGVFRAFNARTGQIVWTFRTGSN